MSRFEPREDILNDPDAVEKITKELLDACNEGDLEDLQKAASMIYTEMLKEQRQE